MEATKDLRCSIHVLFSLLEILTAARVRGRQHVDVLGLYYYIGIRYVHRRNDTYTSKDETRQLVCHAKIHGGDRPHAKCRAWQYRAVTQNDTQTSPGFAPMQRSKATAMQLLAV